ncbi:hypothetical protein KCU79_g14175, partial [Aureobasidium melanogenum]
RAVVEQRRRLLDEWLAWRERTTAELRQEREEEGLPAISPEEAVAKDEPSEEGEGKYVEEILEEILEETEEIID